MNAFEKYFYTGLYGLICVVVLIGCGAGEEGVPVSGQVTFNDEPVPKGEIFFISEESELEGYGGDIIDGAFSANVPEGTYKVRISASRETGEMEPGPGGPDDSPVPVTESYIPAKYNSQTELTATVVSGEELTFELTN